MRWNKISVHHNPFSREMVLKRENLCTFGVKGCTLFVGRTPAQSFVDDVVALSKVRVPHPVVGAILVSLWFSLARSDMFNGRMFTTPAVCSLQSTGTLVCLPIATTEGSWQQVHQAAAQFVFSTIYPVLLLS